MPRRGARVRRPSPGMVSRVCPCSRLTVPPNVACRQCWRALPPQLRQSWLDARDGGGAALEAAEAAVRVYLSGRDRLPGLTS